MISITRRVIPFALVVFSQSACDNQVAFRTVGSPEPSLTANTDDPVAKANQELMLPTSPPVRAPRRETLLTATPPAEEPVNPVDEAPVDSEVVVSEEKCVNPIERPPVEPTVKNNVKPKAKVAPQPEVELTVEVILEPLFVEKRDFFVQKEAIQTAVDILVVEDTTLSMRQDRWTLPKKLAGSFEYLKDLDWRLALTSSDVGRGRLDGRLVQFDDQGTQYLNSSVENYAEKFLDKVSFSQCNNEDYTFGWGAVGCSLNSERMFEAAVKAKNKNPNFFREDAGRALIFITDNSENTPSGDHLTSQSEVLSGFTGDKLLVNGATVEQGDSDCLAKQRGHFRQPAGVFGTSVHQLIEATGGLSVSLCASDLSPLFSNIAEYFGEGELQRVFKLRGSPVKDLRVKIAPAQDLSYGVVRDLLVFSRAPAVGSRISVIYKIQD